MAEASIDIIKLHARIMLASVTARRALLLRPWMADPASKPSFRSGWTGSLTLGSCGWLTRGIFGVSWHFAVNVFGLQDPLVIYGLLNYFGICPRAPLTGSRDPCSTRGIRPGCLITLVSRHEKDGWSSSCYQPQVSKPKNQKGTVQYGIATDNPHGHPRKRLDGLNSIDLKNAYFHVPVHVTFQKDLLFCVCGIHFQFVCLSYSLSTSLRAFSQVLVVVAAYERHSYLSLS